jgi:hypothetical protein
MVWSFTSKTSLVTAGRTEKLSNLHRLIALKWCSSWNSSYSYHGSFEHKLGGALSKWAIL